MKSFLSKVAGADKEAELKPKESQDLDKVYCRTLYQRVQIDN